MLIEAPPEPPAGSWQKTAVIAGLVVSGFCALCAAVLSASVGMTLLASDTRRAELYASLTPPPGEFLRASLTPNPLATSFPSPVPGSPPKSWARLYLDDFVEPGAWFVGTDNDDKTQFTTSISVNKYVWRIQASQPVIREEWSGQTFDGNAWVAVQAGVVSGNASTTGYGLALRSTGNRTVYFAVIESGRYDIWKDERDTQDQFLSGSLRSFASRGVAKLEIFRHNSILTFLVNGLVHGRDVEFDSGELEIGLFVRLYEGDEGALLDFRRLEIYAPKP